VSDRPAHASHKIREVNQRQVEQQKQFLVLTLGATADSGEVKVRSRFLRCTIGGFTPRHIPKK
jgi:hypothetical protein